MPFSLMRLVNEASYRLQGRLAVSVCSDRVLPFGPQGLAQTKSWWWL